MQANEAEHGCDRAAEKHDLHWGNVRDLFDENVCNEKRERRQEHRSHAGGQELSIIAQRTRLVVVGLESEQPQSTSQPGLFENDRVRRKTSVPT